MKYTILTAVLAAGLSSCTLFSHTAAPTPTPSQPSILASKNLLENEKPNDTAFQFYRLLATNPTNVNLSPLSLKIAFSLIYPGTAGSTRKLYEQIFGFNEAVTNPFAKEYDLSRKIEGEKSPERRLLIANSAWIKNPKDVLGGFVDSLDIQHTEIGKLRLEDMNEWVSQSTSKKNPKLFEKLPANLQFLIVNAIYFKQRWSAPFDPKKTSVAPFQSSPNETSNVSTIHDERDVPYYEDGKSKWIALNYEKSPFVMYLGLPLKRFDIRSIEDQISSGYVDILVSKLKHSKVNITLPKFKFAQTASLKAIFENAGYGSVFDKGDYSNVAKPKPVLSDVIQATSIEVDESGTESSVATGIVLREGAAREPLLEKSFFADQPFVFIVRNEETKEIYWLGKVHQPLLVKAPAPVNLDAPAKK
jgi:serpin B